uniref:Cytochrome b5 n=1 Tax=Magallana gigas TaxID=29159 RepID=K1QEP7_MAGGI
MTDSNSMAVAAVVSPSAHLQTTVTHRSPRVPEFSKDEVADHCEIHSCWIIVCDKVYDVTNFTREHPGGLDVIMEYGGRDATVAFMDKGHSNDAWIVLSDYYIGELVKLVFICCKDDCTS